MRHDAYTHITAAAAASPVWNRNLSYHATIPIHTSTNMLLLVTSCSYFLQLITCYSSKNFAEKIHISKYYNYDRDA